MPCRYDSLAIDAMLLAEDLKDKKNCARARERNAVERASSSSSLARAIACRSKAPNVSIKTAVISTTTASNNLMINY